MLARSYLGEKRPLTSWGRPDFLLNDFPLEHSGIAGQSSDQGSCELRVEDSMSQTLLSGSLCL